MRNDIHDRARDLVTASSVEGLTPAETAWLHDHLASCSDCRQYSDAMALSRQALHSLSFRVNPSLIAATQARVHMRARELRERDQRLIPVLISCVLALAVCAVSMPLLWQTFAWIGNVVHLPSLVWQTGFALTWFVPAVLATIILLMLKEHRSETTAD
jgi:predicted anti-sigma-YlaC factor YlaD